MATGPRTEGDDARHSPKRLAEQVETLASTLAECTQLAANGELSERLAESHQEAKAIGSALRGLSLVFEANRAEALSTREEELRTIVVSIGETIQELAKTNQNVGKRMGDQMRELDAIAKTPGGPDLTTRLRDVLHGMRRAAGDLGGHLDTMSDQVQTANERVAILERELNEARERSLYDQLTRVYSRATLDESLLKAIGNGDTKGTWCFIIFDIDRFKTVNDTFGHLVGDALLIKVARVIQETLEANAHGASLARYGGDEFGIIVPKAALAKAATIAEMVRDRVEASRWQYSRDGAIRTLQATISIGVAQFRPHDTVSTLVQRADQALYQAKRDGRNQVALAPA